MMKASNPIISNPLSRSNKRSGDGPMLLVWITSFGVLFLCFFYFTVHQAISASTQKNRLKNLSNVHPNADGIQIQDPQRINKESEVDVTAVAHNDKVILSTAMGDIVITLLPELSPESVAYIYDIVQTGCDRCTFYRVEKPGIFQGMIKSESITPTSVKGQCPPEDLAKPQRCPEHDKNCGCHGPLMTKGMVGWAGGGTGPDFFIDTYDAPATHWGNQHTVWGKVMNGESLAIITRIYDLPATNRGGMTFLDENIKFTMSLEPA